MISFKLYLLLGISITILSACSSSISDEAQLPGGHGVCKTCADCVGQRQCVNGFCCGIPHEQTECRNNSYIFDESVSHNKCSSDCDCGGNRFCSVYGWCHGTAKLKYLSCEDVPKMESNSEEQTHTEEYSQTEDQSEEQTLAVQESSDEINHIYLTINVVKQQFLEFLKQIFKGVL